MPENRLCKFKELLKKKYGLRLVNELLDANSEEETIKFIEDKVALNKFIIEFTRNNREGCDNSKCIDVFRDSFQERPMEIPVGILTMNFKDGERAAKLMLVGEAAGPSIATQLNFTYAFTNLYIKKDGGGDDERNREIFEQLEKEVSDETLNNLRYKEFKYWKKSSKKEKLERYRKTIEGHNLWNYLADIFNDDFDYIKNNLYITDLCKCNAKGNQKWKNCYKECVQFLYEEVKLIIPLLIIFLGKKSQEEFNKFLEGKRFEIIPGKVEGKEININDYYENFKKLRFFNSFEINGQKIFMITIYHNRWLTDYLDEKKLVLVKKYKEQCRKFIKEVILPLLNTEF